MVLGDVEYDARLLPLTRRSLSVENRNVENWFEGQRELCVL
jgi:hypothetical protein